MAKYLQISTIQDSTVKQLAEKSNIETKNNDTLETNNEINKFTNLIISAFSQGKITTEVAKKYINSSNSIWAQKDKSRDAYVKEIITSLQRYDGSRVFRCLMNGLACISGCINNSGDNICALNIKVSAERQKYKQNLQESLQKSEQSSNELKELIEKTKQDIEKIKQDRHKCEEIINEYK